MWSLLRKKPADPFGKGAPCERCDAWSLDHYQGYWKAWYWWPEQLEGIVLHRRNYRSMFTTFYVRPLVLCAEGVAAHVCWFNRREFIQDYPLGQAMLKEAQAAGALTSLEPLQLIGTSMMIREAADYLALAEVGTWSLEIASRVVTRRAWDAHGDALGRLVAWVEQWHQQNPVLRSS